MRRRVDHRVGSVLAVVLAVVVGLLVTGGPAQASTRLSDGDDDCSTQSTRALLSPYTATWNDGYLAYVDPWAKPKVPCTADGQPLSLGPPFGVYEEYPGQLLPPSLWRSGAPCHWWDNACFAGYQRCGIAGPFSCPDPALQPYLVSSDPANPNVVQPLSQQSNSFAPLYGSTPDTPPTVSSSNPQFAPLYATTPDTPPTVSSSNPQFAPLYGSTPDTPPTVSSSAPDSSSAPVEVPAPSLPSLPGVDQSSGQSDSSSSSSQSDSSSSSGQSDSSGSSGQLQLPSQSDSSGSSGQVELPSQPEVPQVQSVDPGSSSSGDSGSSSGSSSLGSVLSGQ